MSFGSLFAQTFPVTLVPQAFPPSPIFFSAYADASTANSPLRLQILLNDRAVANREIRLRAFFQGNGITFSQWSFLPHWAKSQCAEMPQGYINARQETLMEKPTFKQSALKRRCINCMIELSILIENKY